ncbi:MAG: M20/M25/M40 family metallo-hydrolase [Desulfurococcales archaeon]|nr:M20/M25/M40 family metallo-hydrolase [Desulfurococcales archaeon]
MEGLASLLADLVRVPTVNDPSSGLLVGPEQGEEIRGVLSRYGFEADLLVNEGVPILLHVEGEGRPVILFQAHFDVVPPGPGWKKTKPFEPLVEGGRLYGRGAADDKSNVAAIAWALRGYKPRRGTLIIAFTGDEEIGGRRGAGYLAEKLEREGLLPDYLVNGDGSLSRVITRRRASFTASITLKPEPATGQGTPTARRFETSVTRSTMHSAYFVPGVDRHALIAASLWARDHEARVAGLNGEWVKSNVLPRSIELTVLEGTGSGDYDEALTRLVKSIVPLSRAPIPTERYSDYGATVNPNVYRGENGAHKLILDIRAMTSSTDIVEKTLAVILRETLPDGSLSVRGGGGYLYTSRDSRLVIEAQRINANLGLPSEPVEAGGASDSRFYSPRGVEAIDYGPLGGNIHGPDEYVELEHLEKAARFYRLIAEKLTY